MKLYSEIALRRALRKGFWFGHGKKSIADAMQWIRENQDNEDEFQSAQRHCSTGAGSAEEGGLKNGGWISVKDETPEEQIEVLVYAPDCNIIGNVLVGTYFTGSDTDDESWTVYDFAESKLYEKVTHWMPLPEKPGR